MVFLLADIFLDRIKHFLLRFGCRFLTLEPLIIVCALVEIVDQLKHSIQFFFLFVFSVFVKHLSKVRLDDGTGVGDVLQVHSVRDNLFLTHTERQ